MKTTNPDPPPAPELPTGSAELEQLLARIRDGGESIASYCKRHGYPAWKLYQAKQRAAQRKLAAAGLRTSALVPVSVVPDRTASPLELHVDARHRVVLRADFDAVALRRLLEVLRSC